MAELNYSINALNRLTSFHRKKYIVFIEGEDDEPFWDEVFRLSGLESYYLKVAGGRPEIEKFEEAILNHGADIVVARDCDYAHLLKQQHHNARILYTYGYSIENSLYCVPSIAKSIMILSRKTRDDLTQEIENWLETYLSSLENLLVYDLANEIYGKGQKVMGDNCAQFLTSNRGHNASTTKIEAHIQKIKQHFLENELQEAKKRIEQSDKSLFFIIRGHFLTNAIINFIKKVTGLKSISHEMLYGQMIALFPNHCAHREDIRYLAKQISNLTS